MQIHKSRCLQAIDVQTFGRSRFFADDPEQEARLFISKQGYTAVRLMPDARDDNGGGCDTILAQDGGEIGIAGNRSTPVTNGTTREIRRSTSDDECP
jgi:hypothetical protein